MLLRPDVLARVGVTLLLCLTFAIGLVGRLPFWLAAASYLFTQISVLQYPDWKAKGGVVRGFALAALIACAAGVAIAFMFQDVFLVRLP